MATNIEYIESVISKCNDMRNEMTADVELRDSAQINDMLADIDEMVDQLASDLTEYKD